MTGRRPGPRKPTCQSYRSAGGRGWAGSARGERVCAGPRCQAYPRGVFVRVREAGRASWWLTGFPAWDDFKVTKVGGISGLRALWGWGVRVWKGRHLLPGGAVGTAVVLGERWCYFLFHPYSFLVFPSSYQKNHFSSLEGEHL